MTNSPSQPSLVAPQSIATIQQKIITDFAKLDDWQAKYHFLIEKGIRLKDLPAKDKIEENRVKGCQSQVWLTIESDTQKRLQIQATSDAAIVRGLISLLLEVFNNQQAEDIINAKLDFLVEIGLIQHLSGNRKNGLAAMIKQIFRIAKEYTE